MKYAVIYSQAIQHGRDQGYPETATRLFRYRKKAWLFREQQELQRAPGHGWMKPLLMVRDDRGYNAEQVKGRKK